MRVSTTATASAPGDSDTVAVGVFDGGRPPAGSPEQVTELLGSREARTSLGALALAHADGRRWLIVGLGARERFDAERARVAAAAAGGRARELSTRTLCWVLPEGAGAAIAAGLVEGTVLADYRFDRAKGAGASHDDADAPRSSSRR